MVNSIKVLSRNYIEHWIKHRQAPNFNSWALISIYESDDLITLENKEILKALNCKDVLSVKFHDIEAKTYEKIKIDHQGRPLQLFDKGQARQIIDFIDQLPDIDTLVVQCAAGISRSGAVGLFICRYLNMDETKFREDNHILPNFYVLDILNKESGINDSYVKAWQTPVNEKLRARIDKMFF